MPLIRQEQRGICLGPKLVLTMFRDHPGSRFKQWAEGEDTESFIDPALVIRRVKKDATKAEPLFLGDAQSFVDIRADHPSLLTKSREFQILKNRPVGIGVGINKDDRTCSATERFDAQRAGAREEIENVDVLNRETTHEDIENRLTHLIGSWTKPVPFGDFEVEATSGAGNDAHCEGLGVGG